MDWPWAVIAIVTPVVAALTLRLALWRNKPTRILVWLIASLITALAPCLVPLTALHYRAVAALIAVAILTKLYDALNQPQVARSMKLPSYLVYLANCFWLVLARKPTSRSAAVDRQRLIVWTPAAGVLCVTCAWLFSIDFSRTPFVVEHSLKVAAVIVALTLVTNSIARTWRLIGGIAWEPMNNPAAARTPADFWRRWNRPAQQFFHEYVFLPCGGMRRPIRGTLATFAASGLVHEYVFGIATGRVQGWQMLFFMMQGLAAVATHRLRPQGWVELPCVAVTIAFNLMVAVWFFNSVDDVLPFYSPRVSE